MALTDYKIKASKPKDRQYKLYDEFGLFMIVTLQAVSGGGLDIHMEVKNKHYH